MASLAIQSEGVAKQVFTLNLGTNRFGRSSENEFRIEHVTVSSQHCEVILQAGSLVVRDCDSTNGTFVDGRRVTSAPLKAGQTLSLGDVNLLVESTEVTVSIPKIETPIPAPPVVFSDGSILCPRHRNARATHQCTHCRQLLCDACVHRLRRRGGKLLKLCPLCSHRCERLGGEKKPTKKGLIGFLQRTVKLPFLRKSQNQAVED
jgi:pSer/pThr/pTyr-binding forkhead associated (FHA) protein